MSSQNPDLQGEVSDDFPLFTVWLSKALHEDTLQGLVSQAEHDLDTLALTVRESSRPCPGQLGTMALLADFIASARPRSSEHYDEVPAVSHAKLHQVLETTSYR